MMRQALPLSEDYSEAFGLHPLSLCGRCCRFRKCGVRLFCCAASPLLSCGECCHFRQIAVMLSAYIRFHCAAFHDAAGAAVCPGARCIRATRADRFGRLRTASDRFGQNWQTFPLLSCSRRCRFRKIAVMLSAYIRFHCAAFHDAAGAAVCPGARCIRATRADRFGRLRTASDRFRQKDPPMRANRLEVFPI